MSALAGPPVLPQWHAGVKFRSTLEARWAIFFDHLNIGWEYEPEGFVIAGRPYRPDFLLDCGTWVEVKGDPRRLDVDLMVAAAKELPPAKDAPRLLILGNIPAPAHKNGGTPADEGDWGWIGMGPMTTGEAGDWYHRGPCGSCPPCRICGGDSCYVWNDNISPEVHVCAECGDLPNGGTDPRTGSAPESGIEISHGVEIGYYGFGYYESKQRMWWHEWAGGILEERINYLVGNVREHLLTPQLYNYEPGVPEAYAAARAQRFGRQ